MKVKDVFTELLDSQKIFVNDVVIWSNIVAVVSETYYRHTFRFISIVYFNKDSEKVTRHYVEQSHVKLIGRNYRRKCCES